MAFETISQILAHKYRRPHEEGLGSASCFLFIHSGAAGCRKNVCYVAREFCSN